MSDRDGGEDLSVLAQAVVDAHERYQRLLWVAPKPSRQKVIEAGDAVPVAERALGVTLGMARTNIKTARAILTALNAEHVRGSTQTLHALRDVLALWISRSAPGGDEHCALTTVAEWVHEKLAANSERSTENASDERIQSDLVGD